MGLHRLKGYADMFDEHLHNFRAYVIHQFGPVEEEYYPVAICTGMPPAMSSQYLALALIPLGDGIHCHTTCPCLGCCDLTLAHLGSLVLSTPILMTTHCFGAWHSLCLLIIVLPQT